MVTQFAMSKKELLQSIRQNISAIIATIKKIPETIRFWCTKDKLLLNVWMQLCHDDVIHSNFGDELNYYIVKSLTNKSLFNQSSVLVKNKENFLVIGSIIETHTNSESVIWGSGAMFGGERPLREKPKRVLAVRGPLTREYLLSQGVDCPEIYGDPALLLPRIYSPQIEKKYKLGIIPHYVDFNSKYLSEIRNDSAVKIIKLRGYEDWNRVIDEILECEFVVSSSLHGLIISDAYGIPNKWIKLSENISGGSFKYLDYFMSVGKSELEPLLIEHTVSVEELVAYKEQYTPIVWDAEKLLSVSPFKLVN